MGKKEKVQEKVLEGRGVKAYLPLGRSSGKEKGERVECAFKGVLAHAHRHLEPVHRLHSDLRLANTHTSFMSMR